MSKIRRCKCKKFMVTEIEYTSIIFDPACPHCGQLWSSFTSEDDPPATNKSDTEPS